MTVHCEIKSNVGVITLDRVKALNAITKEMIESIYQHLQLWKKDPGVAMVLIRSASTDLFSAGGDVRSVWEMRLEPLDSKLVFFEEEFQMIHLLNTYPKPVLSLMNGLTMGGGVGLGMHVAFPVAGEHMVFAMPETMIGFFPDVAGTAVLNKLPRAWQNYLGVFGHRLNTEQLESFGLVYGCVPISRWKELTDELIATDWSDDKFHQLSEILASYVFSKPIEPAYEPFPHFNSCFDTDSFYQLMENIHQVGDDSLHDIQMLCERLCPLSMIVTFEQIRLAQHFSVQQALVQDFGLLQHFLELPDFYEGVRAMLIDKDKKPQWSYSDWMSVPYSVIQKIFYDATCIPLRLTS